MADDQFLLNNFRQDVRFGEASTAKSLDDIRRSYFSLKILSINSHFSPARACGKACWKRHMSFSHS
jgi:hypothetical protein